MEKELWLIDDYVSTSNYVHLVAGGHDVQLIKT